MMKIAILNPITRTPTHHVIPAILSNRDAMIVKLAQEIQTLGHEVVLYVSDLYKPSIDEDLGIKIVYCKTFMRKLPEIPMMPALLLELKDQYDVILASEAFQWSTIIAVWARMLSFSRKPKVYVWQELSVHQRIFRGLPSLFFHRVVLRFFLDWQIHRYIPRGIRAMHFLAAQGIPLEKFLTPIPHGVDQRIFFPERDDFSARYLFSPSRLVEDKGIDVLLHGFRLVRDAGIDINLVIQGDGPDADIYIEMANHLGIGSYVQFNRGRVDHEEMRRFYSNATLTVIASKRDFMLFSIMESLACNTPVIVSDAVDISEEITSFGGGMVFKCDNANMLAKQILEYLQIQELAYQLRKEASQVSDRYKNNQIARTFLTTFHQSI